MFYISCSLFLGRTLYFVYGTVVYHLLLHHPCLIDGHLLGFVRRCLWCRIHEWSLAVYSFVCCKLGFATGLDSARLETKAELPVMLVNYSKAESQVSAWEVQTTKCSISFSPLKYSRNKNRFDGKPTYYSRGLAICKSSILMRAYKNV